MFQAGEIYLLPDGRELMASGDGSTFYGLADNGYDLLRYELDEQGGLACAGRITAWSLDDLRRQANDLAPCLRSDGITPDCVVK